MINFSQLREFAAKQAEEDRQNRIVDVQGPTLDDALKKASIELALPLKRLEYEVVEQGAKGFAGMGSKPWKLHVYEKTKEVKVSGIGEEDLLATLAAVQPEKEKDLPGGVQVRISPEGAFLKVTKPKGKGARVSEIMALEKLSQRGITGFDASLVARVVKHADGDFIRVGDAESQPEHDSNASLELSDGDMKAWVTVSEPGPGGSDLGADGLRAFLQANGVTDGILEEALASFEDMPVYREPILLAEGIKAKDGANARVAYNFQVERDSVKLKEKMDGRVDFREINKVENVVAGQLVARKIPAEEGIEGKTVTGRTTPATSGKDCEIPIGKNVKLSDDGLQAIAEINGQVLLLGQKINVEPIYTVGGDVDMRTGNILFLGTVFVKGNVGDGFSVKAAGNIEVFGNVGKCVLDAEGDIVVHQGILGKGEGSVRCGRSLYSKFIENANVEAGENILVTDGIMHSKVDANKMILCQGKRAQVVGGRLRAAEEINSKILGSVSGTETLLEVGYDPKSKERLAELGETKTKVEKELEEVDLNIKTLENFQRVQKKLPEEKARYLAEQSEKRSQLLAQLEEASRELGSINAYLAQLTTIGKISSSEKVYPGVRVSIKTAALTVRTEFKYVTFYLQGNEVKVTKYEGFDEELMRRK